MLEACRDHWRETDLFYLVFIAVPAIPSPFWKTALSFFFLEAHSCRYFFSRDAAIPEKGRSKTISRIFHGFFCCFCKIGKGDGFEMFWEGKKKPFFFRPSPDPTPLQLPRMSLTDDVCYKGEPPDCLKAYGSLGCRHGVLDPWPEIHNAKIHWWSAGIAIRVDLKCTLFCFCCFFGR